MKALVLVILAGLLLIAFGCPADEAAPKEVPETEEPMEAPRNESTLFPSTEENITHCQDGTAVGKCSVTKPKICDIYGNLVDDVGSCGCPEKSIKMGNECIFSCDDGTLIGECSSNRPYYCNSKAELEEKASLCGCPLGYDLWDEGCRNTCEDGTAKYVCSAKTPPLYCNGDYELVMNPLVCGCYPWEFLLEGECFDPSSKKYSSGETIRISETLNILVDHAKEKNCGNENYVVLHFTVANSGDETVEIEDYNFKLFRDEYRTAMQNPSKGCTVANLFKWREIPAGKTESGTVWFRIVGGGDIYHVEYVHKYSPSVLKEFYIYIVMED